MESSKPSCLVEVSSSKAWSCLVKPCWKSACEECSFSECSEYTSLNSHRVFVRCGHLHLLVGYALFPEPLLAHPCVLTQPSLSSWKPHSSLVFWAFAWCLHIIGGSFSCVPRQWVSILEDSIKFLIRASYVSTHRNSCNRSAGHVRTFCFMYCAGLAVWVQGSRIFPKTALSLDYAWRTISTNVVFGGCFIADFHSMETNEPM